MVVQIEDIERDKAGRVLRRCQQPSVSDAELSMAKMLVNAMVQEFQPQEYKDEYKARLWEIIQQKILGKEITVPPESGETTVIDIMEALKQSLERVNSAS